MDLSTHAEGLARISFEYFETILGLEAHNKKLDKTLPLESGMRPIYQLSGQCMELCGKAMLASVGVNKFDASGHDLLTLKIECDAHYSDFNLLYPDIPLGHFEDFSEAYKSHVFSYGALYKKSKQTFCTGKLSWRSCRKMLATWVSSADNATGVEWEP